MVFLIRKDFGQIARLHRHWQIKRAQLLKHIRRSGNRQQGALAALAACRRIKGVNLSSPILGILLQPFPGAAADFFTAVALRSKGPLLSRRAPAAVLRPGPVDDVSAQSGKQLVNVRRVHGRRAAADRFDNPVPRLPDGVHNALPRAALGSLEKPLALPLGHGGNNFLHDSLPGLGILARIKVVFLGHLADRSITHAAHAHKQLAHEALALAGRHDAAKAVMHNLLMRPHFGRASFAGQVVGHKVDSTGTRVENALKRRSGVFVRFPD